MKKLKKLILKTKELGNTIVNDAAKVAEMGTDLTDGEFYDFSCKINL